MTGGDQEKMRPERLLRLSREAEFLRTILRAGMLIFAILLPLTPLIGEPPGATALTYGLYFGIALVSYLVLRRGHVRTAGGLALGATWWLLTLQAMANGGFQREGIAFVVLTLVAGLLWGTRPAALVAGLGATTALGVILLGRWGLLPEPVPTGETRAWVGLVAALVLVVVILNLGLRSHRSALTSARRNERRYADLIRYLPDAVVTLDRKGRIIGANPAAEELTGHEEEQVLGRHFGELGSIPQSDLDPALSGFQAILRGERPDRLEFELHHRDGSRVPVEIKGRLAPRAEDADVQLVIRDIRERRQAEAGLRAAEQRNRDLFEGAPVMYLISRTEADAPLIENCNELFATSLGYSRRDLIGRPLADFYAPESREELLLGGGYQRALDGLFVVEERKLLTREGRILDTLLRSVPVRDSHGEVTGTRAMYLDITERKRAMEALAASEERYRRLFHDSRDPVFITTPEGELLDMNPAGVKLFGYSSRREMLEAGAPLSLYRHAADREQVNRLLSENGYVEDLELRLQRKSGEHLLVLETATAVLGHDGKVVAYQGFLRDVTERQKLEHQIQQGQRLEAIGRLAGGVAHDFNNLLTLIIGYTELLLRQDGISDPTTGALDKIREAGLRGTSLTRQLLAFTRQQVLEPRIVDLNTVVMEIEDLLRRTLGEQIDLRLGLDADLGTTRVDPGQIDQILMNLVVNARDAMPGGGRLSIQTANVDLDARAAARQLGASPGKHVMLSVTDSGCGMDEKIRNRAFEPFFTTKQRGGGTGLGLSTVYGIVKQSGGHIILDSRLGEGSTFRIYLPRSNGRAEIEAAPAEQDLVTGGNETVLLVEDDRSVRELVARTLGELGYRVRAAADAEEAIELFSDAPQEIDLLLTDLILPTSNGLELAREIRSRQEGTAVLAMSGYSDLGPMNASEIGREIPLLRKPFERNELARKMRQALAARV